jgi:hypothetical protein
MLRMVSNGQMLCLNYREASFCSEKNGAAGASERFLIGPWQAPRQFGTETFQATVRAGRHARTWRAARADSR